MPIRLDQRLTTIANLVDYGKVADVGCDHGKLGYYLVSTDRASEVIATDISAPSLAKAEELAKENGVQDVMKVRLGNGLDPVDSQEVDTVIIAGLGGDVISDIILRAHEQGKRFCHFVLSANTHPEKVRAPIVKCGHPIVFDEMLECAGKTYTVLRTDEGESTLYDDQIAYGAFFRTSDNFAFFAKKEIECMQNILSQNPKAVELKAKIDALKGALNQATNA